MTRGGEVSAPRSCYKAALHRFMTGAAIADKLPAMRAFLISLALAAAFVATSAAAKGRCVTLPVSTSDAASSAPLVAIAPEEAAVPARLAPLAADSPWQARFEAAADELFVALQSRDESRWQPLLGGRWLGEADRSAIAAMIDDPCGAFGALLKAPGPIERRILGWNIPASYSAADKAEIAARPEAEALACWSARSATAWPLTAAEADNRGDRPYACARIAYSVRGDTPLWRGFIETPR